MTSVLPELLGNLAVIALLLTIVAIRALIKRRRRIAANHKANVVFWVSLQRLVDEANAEIDATRAAAAFPQTPIFDALADDFCKAAVAGIDDEWREVSGL